MERFPVELLYVLGFIAIVLFNFIAQRAARRRQQEEPAEAAAKPAPPAEEQPMEDLWGRTPAAAGAPAAARAPAPVARPAPLPAPAEPLRRRLPARALLDDRRGLRRAFILMTVLGPCRALEPPQRH